MSTLVTKAITAWPEFWGDGECLNLSDNPDSKTDQILIRKGNVRSGFLVRKCLVLYLNASKIRDSG